MPCAFLSQKLRLQASIQPPWTHSSMILRPLYSAKRSFSICRVKPHSLSMQTPSVDEDLHGSRKQALGAFRTNVQVVQACPVDEQRNRAGCHSRQAAISSSSSSSSSKMHLIESICSSNHNQPSSKVPTCLNSCQNLVMIQNITAGSYDGP